MLLVLHVDKIEDDNTPEIADPQLSCNRYGCLEVGFQYGLGMIATTKVGTGIDIDGRHRLSLVDHQVASGFQLDRTTQGPVDLVIDAINIE